MSVDDLLARHRSMQSKGHVPSATGPAAGSSTAAGRRLPADRSASSRPASARPTGPPPNGTVNPWPTRQQRATTPAPAAAGRDLRIGALEDTALEDTVASPPRPTAPTSPARPAAAGSAAPRAGRATAPDRRASRRPAPAIDPPRPSTRDDDRIDPDPGEDPPRRRLTLPRALAGLLALAVFGTAAFGWAGKTWLGSAIPQVTALDPGSDLIVDADAQRGATNVLVVAGPADSRAGTVAVTHVPAGGGPLTVLSFPPELRIDRPACARWDPGARSYSDQVAPAAAGSPLSEAFAVGGPQCATRAVQQLSGIAITGFLGIDVGRIGAAADALGRVSVCVPRPVDDGELGSVVAQPGRIALDGRQAGAYAAAAAVAGDPRGGRARIERQQLLLGGLVQQAIGGPALLDVAQLGRLRPALAQALVTDGVDLDRMLAMGRSMQNLEADGITFAAVPTSPNQLGGPTLSGVDAAALFAAVRTDRPLNAAAGTGPPTPGQLRVGVLNATERTGLAGTVADSLGALGYGIGEVGTAEQVTPQTLIRFSPDQAAAAALVAGTVPSATSVPDPGTSGVLQLVLGSSFDDVLSPPAATPAARPEPARAGGCG